MEPTKTKPVAEIKQGLIVASIWEDQRENGPRHKVTFTRLYRKGGQWRHAASFNAKDLLTLMHVADLAHGRILQLVERD